MSKGIGAYFSEGIDKLKQNLVPMLVAWIAVMVVQNVIGRVVPLGIGGLVTAALGGPLSVGWMYMCQKMHKGEKADMMDVFHVLLKEQSLLVPSIIAAAPVVLGGILMFVGAIAGVPILVSLAGLMTLVAMLLTVWAYPIVITRKCDGVTALKDGIAFALKDPVGNLIKALVFGICGIILGAGNYMLFSYFMDASGAAAPAGQKVGAAT